MLAFYKEEKFKETPIGKIPEDWKAVKLGDAVIDIYYGITAKAVEHRTNLRMLRTTDIKDYHVDWSSLPFCKITEKRSKISKYLLRKGDLIVARAGTTGVSVLVEKDFDDVIFGSYLIKIRLKNSIFPKFVHYFFQSRFYWNHIVSSQAGSTLKNISLPILKSLRIPLPPLEEQKAIAHILSTIDEAIQKTNEIIEKIKRLKKGLMQELLTKGIGHKEFKDTEIGRIPEEWEIVRFSSLVDFKNGINFEGSLKGERGILTVDVLNMYGEGIFLDLSKLYRVNTSVDSKYLLKKGDILIVRSSLKPEGVGWATLFNGHNDPVTFCGFLIRARLKGSLGRKVLPEFLTYFLRSEIARRELISHSGRVAITNVSQTILKSIRIPLPSTEEQKRIVEVLLTTDKRLEVERKKKEKLERIKKALMNLLLTGKIRIKVKENA